MDSLSAAHNQLESSSNLSKTLSSLDALISTLEGARDAVTTSPELTAMHVAKLKQPVKAAFDRMEDDLKEVNKGLNQYQKALKDKFKAAPGSDGSDGPLENEDMLVNRAVAMHLLREGKFGVAGTFVREVNEDFAKRQSEEWDDLSYGEPLHASDIARWHAKEMWRKEFGEARWGDATDKDGNVEMERKVLQTEFTQMYTILDALQNQHDLEPAIAWARSNSKELETRGSNLEFELARLKFIELYTFATDSDDAFSGSIRALEYARSTFPAFSHRYSRETSNLLGSLAFSTSLASSPYNTFFATSLNAASNYESVSRTFTREFCSLLGLSSSSPLYTAITAGSISLPTLSKVRHVLATSGGQWTSVNELPVETPLPPGMQFHSIFVCPVSKEQATDHNPPMMLPCGHVIAKESLEMHARGKQRMKCPYCPGESRPGEAKRVYI